MTNTIADISVIEKYFDLTSQQKQQFSQLQGLYQDWNSKINVISRKDLDSLYVKHVLHSLAIAKACTFEDGAKIMDVGCGGGFPSIPLAIMFPQAEFTAVDSIGKKIKVVNGVAEGIALKNLTAINSRVENIDQRFDYIVSRAVTDMETFAGWVWKKFIPASQQTKGSLPSGILYLKGGDLNDELRTVAKKTSIFDIPEIFKEEFFETKKVVYVRRY